MLGRVAEGHVELETAQVNLQRAQTRSAEESRMWRTDFEQKLNALVEHEQVLDRTMLALTGKVDAIADAQKATDEKLNILIDTVERYIRGRNGKQ